MIEEIQKIGIALLNELINGEVENITEKTRLYGKDGILTSIQLVRFINDVEDAINEKYSTSISLMSEKAFSRNNSPFLNVDSISRYALEELKESDLEKEDRM